MQESLYFIAIVPSDEMLLSSITALKNEVSKEFNTHQALKSPPHITLQRPFRKKSSIEKILLPALNSFANSQNTFEVTLKGYGAFAPKVIYLNIKDHLPFTKLHAQLVTNLKTLNIIDDKELSGNIHPHLTLAHRDLTSENFNRAWNKFRHFKFEAMFKAKQLTLLKHNGKSWEIYKQFEFRLAENTSIV